MIEYIKLNQKSRAVLKERYIIMVIEVCIGSACHVKGSYDVINSLQNLVDDYSISDKVEIHAVFCLGNCANAVSVRIDDEIYSVSPSSVKEFFEKNVLAVVGL